MKPLGDLRCAIQERGINSPFFGWGMLAILTIREHLDISPESLLLLNPLRFAYRRVVAYLLSCA